MLAFQDGEGDSLEQLLLAEPHEDLEELLEGLPSDTSDNPAKPPLTIRHTGHAGLGVEKIVLRGQAVAVETVWAAEVPRSPEDFSLDVRISNGMTVVVNSRRELEGCRNML